ncbi:helix-turn-helix domain-containing protein [Arenibaculum pallidiluteum]|uniref:helix-turn-helix domain-containing protein n=1 Tax=Arenibaculum pallidiluteum TaxID=2812559 RepID=UPI001A975BC6|nr:helix-turn-helix transcriptional regulator [Arenibaculum pallidiluteum]
MTARELQAPEDGAPPTIVGLGPTLATWRAVRGIKQSHAAELCGVSQATISRWESGTQEPTPGQAARLRRLMAARADSAADRALLRLVQTSPHEIHLVCDLTHRLLAASPRRVGAWRVPANALLGVSMWRFASPEIVAAEQRLATLGWFGAAPPEVPVETGENASQDVPIRRGRFRWIRLQLADGSFARLVESEG